MIKSLDWSELIYAGGPKDWCESHQVKWEFSPSQVRVLTKSSVTNTIIDCSVEQVWIKLVGMWHSPYSGFILREKTSVNFVFLWQIAKVLSAKINPESITDTMTSQDIPRNSYQLLQYGPNWVLMTALFALSQRTDFILPTSLGPLSTAAPASTITAANKDETGSRWTGRKKELYTDLQVWGTQPLHSQRIGADRKNDW